MAKKDQLLEALKQKAPATIKAGEDAAAKAIEEEEQRAQTEKEQASTRKRPRPQKKAASKKPKRALSIVLSEAELQVLRPIQQQFEETHSRTCGLATAIKITIRAMKPSTDVTSISQALVEEDRRGKRG